MQQVATNETRTASPVAAGTDRGTGRRDPAAAPALEVVDLSRDFRSGLRRRRARGIEGVSFSVRPGCVFALLGHNGAGKTTTINCVLDLVHPSTGRVRIFGRDHREPAARADVGYLPERPYFFEHLTGRELLNFFADLLHMDRARRNERIDQVLDIVGMADAADTRLRKYSKGMLQRIGLGQALLGDPGLLILDEPMSGLDPVGRRQVRELLLALRDRGKTIILSSHIVPDIEMLADEVAILSRGRLVARHAMSELSRTTLYEVQVVGNARYAERVLGDFAWTAHGEVLHVQADGATELNRLLSVVTGGGGRVLGVGTRRSGLEEIFMQTRRDREPDAQQEVTR